MSTIVLREQRVRSDTYNFEVSLVVASKGVAWHVSSADEALSLFVVVELVVCYFHESVSSTVYHISSIY